MQLQFCPPVWRLLFQQEFEQWCDMNLTDEELRLMEVCLPHVARPTSSLREFVAMANIPTFAF